jgi:hypothetical protein
MRVLIGCEESDNTRSEFEAAGHDAWSCDLLPSRNPENKNHLKCDVMTVLDMGWDLIILHPDCTRLSLSGNRTYGKNVDGTPKPKHHLRLESIEWTKKLWETAISVCDRVALENPASVIFQHLTGDFQWIQPYQFGHMEQKKTGLKLHGLPKLLETDNVYDQMMLLPKRERERVFFMAPGVNRKRDRSTTYPGISKAFAEQWGSL